MKKAIFLFLVCALCLCACGKSEAVIAAEKAIANIGEVTFASEDVIKNAQKYYNLLTDAEKAKVENRIVLADAIEAYEAAMAAYEEELRAGQYEKLKNIFGDLKQAYELVDNYGSDLYEAWRLGIYEKDQFQGSNLNGAMKFLDSKLRLDYKELVDGAAFMLIEKVYGSSWAEKTDEVKQKNRDAVATGTLFYMYSDQIPAACVNIVVGAYQLNGDVAGVNAALDGCAKAVSEMEGSGNFEKESEQLEQLYAAIKAYLDYCQKPSGTFNQASDTISGYRNAAREHISSLDALFAE